MADIYDFKLHQLAAGDIMLFRQLLEMFGTAFEDLDTYTGAQPSDEYLDGLLHSGNFIALTAVQQNVVIGGLTAYELKKFERERSEIYIYDLAVAEQHRRQGIATALIMQLKQIAADRGVYVIFVQADITDPPAISLYSKLGTREDILHFDIDIS